MFNILLSISIRKIAWFVIHNWVIFAIGAFIVCAGLIVWLIREVIKSGNKDEDEDPDKSHVTAQINHDKSDVLEETVEPEIADIFEPAPEVEIIDIPPEAQQQIEPDISEVLPEAEAPEVLDETSETKETEPIVEVEQIDITEDVFLQEEPETIEEFPELDEVDLQDEDIELHDIEAIEEDPKIHGSDSPEDIVVADLVVTVEDPASPKVTETPIIIPEAKDEKAGKKQQKRKAKEEKQRLKAQQKEQKKGKKSKRRKKSQSFDINSPELITESDYRLITQRILKIRQKPRSILFAAAARKSLPITIPVNIAIQLAEDKHSCLLIDLDLKRNAIAKAFDIDDKPNPKRHRPVTCPTSIKELYVWPAHNFTRSRHMNIISLVRAAVDKFDYVLLSAPYLIGSPDRVQIATSTEFSLIFTQDSTQAELLDTIIELTNSRILANYQIRS